MSCAGIRALSGFVPCSCVIGRRNHMTTSEISTLGGQAPHVVHKLDLDFDSYRVGCGGPPSELSEVRRTSSRL
jgi:hypothetical protein